ncbi:MAG: hypothetical protein R3228_19255, partial [Halioglobus sp.]|nr:hypothetical protein [Halioglobus sp.]
VPDAQDLPGQYVSQGRVLGYVIDDSSAVAQVVVTQQDQDRIASSLEGVQVRLAGAMHDVLPGRLLRAVPQASHQLPSKVLSVDGGGRFVPDPEGITELSTRERLFTYEIELPVPVERAMIGSRVHVRFDHGQESLWTQLSRRVRQLFLRHFDV